MSWSVDDIRKKLQEDPGWEPEDSVVQEDPDFWQKFDEAMDSLDSNKGSNDNDDFSSDEDFDWDEEDEDW